MKVLAIIATAAAVRLGAEEDASKKYDTSKWPSAKKVFKHCNTNGDKLLDAGEVVACMKNAGFTWEEGVKTADHILKYAHLPESALEPIANGISAHTKGKVSVDAAKKAIIACDTDKSKSLSYGETVACLKKHQKVLGIKTDKDWSKAKWALAHFAVIDKKSFKAAYKTAKAWAASQ